VCKQQTKKGKNMQAQFDRKEFVTALKKAAHCAETRTPLPILQCVVLDCATKHARLTCSNLEQTVVATCEYDVCGQTEVGSVAIPAKRLLQIADAMSGDTLKVATVAHQVRLSSGASQFTLNTQPAEDFPETPLQANKAGFKVDAKAFLRALQVAAAAKSQDAARQVLNGVLLEASGKQMTISGTDGKRLHCATAELAEPIESPVASIFPPRLIADLPRFIAANEWLELVLTDNCIAIAQDGILCISKCIDGLFPNVKQVIPPKFDKVLRILPDQLRDALRRVSLVSGEGNGINLSVSGETLTLTAVSAELGEGSDAVALAEPFAGKCPDFQFNPALLQAGLDGLTGSEVAEMSINDAVSPVKLSSDGFFAIIMPMRS